MKKKRSLKLAKPTMPTIPALPAVLRQDSEVVVPSEVPRITTDTIAAHREEVIGGARKYILRLGHTKHRILGITVSLLVLGVLAAAMVIALPSSTVSTRCGNTRTQRR